MFETIIPSTELFRITFEISLMPSEGRRVSKARVSGGDGVNEE